MKTQLTCESFLNGKHSDTVEINTSIPYVAIDEFFIQNEEAVKVIHEINVIYNANDCSVLDAVNKWANYNL